MNNYTQKEQERSQVKEKFESGLSALVQVMLDGPYGGSSVDLGRYESALLVAGGSGITFTLGLLDDIVGRCTKLGRSQGERTRKIEFAWCIRSFGDFFLAKNDGHRVILINIHRSDKVVRPHADRYCYGSVR